MKAYSARVELLVNGRPVHVTTTTVFARTDAKAKASMTASLLKGLRKAHPKAHRYGAAIVPGTLAAA